MASKYHVVIQVFRQTPEQTEEELMVQVGGETTGPDSFVQAFPDIYRQIDKHIMKVLELGEVIDEPARTPTQESENG